MNIDKKKLEIGMWYEDENGNKIEVPKDQHIGSKEAKELGIVYYKTCFPLDITTNMYKFYDSKDTCKHPLKYRRRTYGWADGTKGCECAKCGKEKVGNKFIPFLFMKWQDGTYSSRVVTFHDCLGSGNQDLVMAMANSGDFTLEEALCVLANACERCANVLAYKYLDGKDGYEEYSDEWKKAGTVCDFCKDMRDKEE